MKKICFLFIFGGNIHRTMMDTLVNIHEYIDGYSRGYGELYGKSSQNTSTICIPNGSRMYSTPIWRKPDSTNNIHLAIRAGADLLCCSGIYHHLGGDYHGIDHWIPNSISTICFC